MKARSEPPIRSDYERITRFTYNTIADEYCRTTPRAGVRNVIEASAAEFASLVRPNGRVLVVGCGDGRDSKLLRAFGFTTVSLDYSSAMLALARRCLDSAPLIMADLRSLPFRPDAFDGVWASAVLYHLRKTALSRVMTEFRALLRPGGILYGNLRKGEGQRLDPAPRSFPRGGARFYAFYSEAELAKLTQGYEVLRRTDWAPILGDDYYQFWLRNLKEARHV